MWDGGDLNEVKAVCDKINSSESWKRELIALGIKQLRKTASKMQSDIIE